MARIPRAYFRPNITRYLTLFVERSGSTHLSTLLASHPDVLSLREELSSRRQQGADGNALLEWTKEFYAPPLVSRHSARGFKTKLVDIPDEDRFRLILEEFDCHLIVLRRRNTVKGALSTINARRLYESTGNWNLLKTSDRLPAFDVDQEELNELIQQRERWDEELEEYASHFTTSNLSIWYEDLLNTEDAVLAEVFEFLGVRPMPLQQKTYKQTSDDLRDVMLNFDEIYDQYANTKYGPMLLEGTDN